MWFSLPPASRRPAIALQGDLPENFSILSAHKYVPPAMELVAQIPQTRVEGFLAAGHAATITGWGIFEDFVKRYKIPVVVAGFEPLDILAGLVRLVELIRDENIIVDNMYPRCVTREGNRVALDQMWRVFCTAGGMWRGIADVPDGNLRLREEFAHIDARRKYSIDVNRLLQNVPSALTEKCICGAIMSGLATPNDCTLFGKECDAENPIGACMVSSEGTCKIWFQYGGHPEL
jgi:hydrogenase expression/formation protein HypD